MNIDRPFECIFISLWNKSVYFIVSIFYFSKVETISTFESYKLLISFWCIVRIFKCVMPSLLEKLHYLPMLLSFHFYFFLLLKLGCCYIHKVATIHTWKIVILLQKNFHNCFVLPALNLVSNIVTQLSVLILSERCLYTKSPCSGLLPPSTQRKTSNR